MIEGYSTVAQALLGTLFTWFLTAVGAALVFFVPKDLSHQAQKKVLDLALGFAAGVMTAASYWSLLAPAIESATASGHYGDRAQWAFFPAAVGLAFGALFVFVADLFLPDVGASSFVEKGDEDSTHKPLSLPTPTKHKKQLRRRKGDSPNSDIDVEGSAGVQEKEKDEKEKEKDRMKEFRSKRSWRRIMLLVLAITVHNFPEGLAVGVGFGAIGVGTGHTLDSARSLTIGIGLQNFPEGLAVSLPLLRLGYSPLKSFWYGQLSGMVEPIGGLLGAAAIALAQPFLPYALAFAAGAMLYVVVQELIPEAHTGLNGRIASLGFMVGFVVMMTLDVALG